jgi:hypothetical protein
MQFKVGDVIEFTIPPEMVRETGVHIMGAVVAGEPEPGMIAVTIVLRDGEYNMRKMESRPKSN